MKKLLILAAAMTVMFAFTACNPEPEEEKKESPVDTKSEFDKMYEKAASEFTVTGEGDTEVFSIKGKGETDKVYPAEDGKTIYVLSKADVDNDEAEPEYTLSGTWEGQIINITKGTVLNLNNLTLSNENESAIYGKKKTEIKAAKGTTNVISVTGTSDEKIGAVTCEKKLEIGGSGNLTIISSFYHGVKAEEVQLKGSSKGIKIYTPIENGEYKYSDGSGINCKTFEVKDPKQDELSKYFTIDFAGFKHGIKADNLIEIHSGKFDFTKVKVPFKTDTIEKDPEGEHKIIISKVEGATLEFKVTEEVKNNLTDLVDSDEVPENLADYFSL